MIAGVKDLSEVVAGQGQYPRKPFLSCKNISYDELVAILHDAPESHSADFIFQPKKLTFAFPYNRGKQWLREIKDILLQNSAEVGQGLFPELYLFIKGSEVKIRGKIFIKTKCASRFSHEKLVEISRKILNHYIILPQKFCSLDISCKRNEDTTVEIGKIQIPNYSGSGFYIHFSLLCKLSWVQQPKPLEFFSEPHEIRIGGFGHNTCGRNGIFFVLVQLFEYGNKLTEIPEHIEKILYSKEYFFGKIYKKYIAADYFPDFLKNHIESISTKPTNFLNGLGERIVHDKFGLGKIIRHYKKLDDERIDVFFETDTIVRTLSLKFACEHIEFTSQKYTNQEFNDKVYISVGAPIFEKCVFKNEVYIANAATPLFISCIFERIIHTAHETRVEFYDCTIENLIKDISRCSVKFY